MTNSSSPSNANSSESKHGDFSIGDNQPEDFTRLSATAPLANVTFHSSGDNNSTSNSGSYHLANGVQFECHVDENDASHVMVSNARVMIGAEVVVSDDSNEAIAFDMPLSPFSSSSCQRSSTPMDGNDDKPSGIEAITVAGERIVLKYWTKDSLEKHLQQKLIHHQEMLDKFQFEESDARRLVTKAIDHLKLASTLATNQKKKYDEVVGVLLTLRTGGFLRSESNDSLVTVFELDEEKWEAMQGELSSELDESEEAGATNKSDQQVYVDDIANHVSIKISERLATPELLSPEPALSPEDGLNSSAPIKEDSPVQSQPLSTRLEVIDDVMNSGKDSGESDSSATIQKDSPIGTKQLTTQLKVRKDVVDSGKGSDESLNITTIQNKSPVECQHPPSQLEIVEEFVDSGKGFYESETIVAPNTSSSSNDGNNKSDVSCSMETNSSAPIRNDSTVEDQNKSVDVANKSVTLRANTSDVAENELERSMSSMLQKRRSTQWTKLVSLDNTAETLSPEPDSQNVVTPTTQVLPHTDMVDQSSDSQLVEDSTTEDVQVEKDASDESSGLVNTGNNSTLSEPEYPSCASLAAEIQAAPQMEIEAEEPLQMQHVEESTTPDAQVAMDALDELTVLIYKDNNSTTSEPESTVAPYESYQKLDIPLQIIKDLIAKVEQDSTKELSNSINAEAYSSTATMESEDSTNVSLSAPVQQDESAEHQLDSRQTSPVVDDKKTLLEKDSEFLPMTDAKEARLTAMTRDKLCLVFSKMFYVNECTELVQKFEVLANIQMFARSKSFNKIKTSFSSEIFVSNRLAFNKQNARNRVITMYRSLQELIVKKMPFDDIAMATLCYLSTKCDRPDIINDYERRLSEQLEAITYYYLQDKLDNYLMTEKPENSQESTNKGDTSHSKMDQILPKFCTTGVFLTRMVCHLEKASSNSLHAHFAVIYDHLWHSSISSSRLDKDFQTLANCTDEAVLVDLEYDYFHKVFQIVQSREALKDLVSKFGFPTSSDN